MVSSAVLVTANGASRSTVVMVTSPSIASHAADAVVDVPATIAGKVIMSGHRSEGFGGSASGAGSASAGAIDASGVIDASGALSIISPQAAMRASQSGAERIHSYYHRARRN